MENLFKDIEGLIKANHGRLKEGKANCIPFTCLPKVSKHVPGIIKGTPYIVGASSGVGKTQLTKFLFVYEAYKYVKMYPQAGISIEMHYFPLEESKEEFMLGMIAKYLSEEHALQFTVQELQGYYQNALDDNVLSLISGAEEYFADLFKYLVIHDGIKNPTGIYKKMRRVAANNGQFFYKDEPVTPPSTNNWSEFSWDRYKENNPYHFIIGIIDHVGLLEEEKNPVTKQMMNKWDTIGKWSQDYSRTMLTKRFYQVIVNVQQMNAAAEEQQYTLKGDSIKDKVKPTHDKLADNKTTIRDAMVALYLFAPARYGFKSWAGYDLTIMKDKFRVLIISKNRYGKPDLNAYLYFDGVTNFFRELPPSDDIEQMETIYTKIKNGEL